MTPSNSYFNQLPAIPSMSNGTMSPGAANYAALVGAADKERVASMGRATERQGQVTGGYDQQIETSRQRGDLGYQNLASNYAQITADAAATRARNLGRIDQYGNSMRSDLAIKSQQALAAAAQSAINRGLGNTTIRDSLVRGQTFDNTRQQLSLEDQLLQNRISTDASLSGAYQNSLLNQAQGLASQWNQNTANDNALASQKLGYIGGIKEDDQYMNIASLYSQGLQMQNANQQAEYDRKLEKLKIPAKFRYVNGQVQKSVDNGHSWQPDPDQNQVGKMSGWLR